MRRTVAGTAVAWIALVALAACGTAGDPAAQVQVGDASSLGVPPDEAVPRPSTSASTSTSTTSTTAATTTTTAPAVQAAALRIEGSHRGIEHFMAGSSRCELLDHRLEETFTLSDGSTLRFDSRYCGTVDATMYWRGTGTYVLTAADGSTLTGTSASESQLPSVGNPYSLEVLDGTGRFAGTTGSCAIDNHLRPLDPGVQEQWGTFVCDLRTAP